MKRFLVLALVLACGGSVQSNGDAGPDGSADGSLDGEGAPDVGTDVAPTKPYDGTVGKACKSDTDCASPNGPGLARCSSSVFAPQDYYPTPVCILPSCSPVSDKNAMHYCDGPDDPSSPGVCVPFGTSGSVCLPKCTYDKNGGAPVGCQAHDACFAYPGAPESGAGYCWAACTQDSDCGSGEKCQTDWGWCVQGVIPPTKSIGAACTASDSNAGACNCLYGTSNTGYCSQSCVVGGAACPTGYVCDSLEERLVGYTTPNVGMGGYCALACGADAGATCTNSTCTSVFASGPDCIPP